MKRLLVSLMTLCAIVFTTSASMASERADSAWQFIQGGALLVDVRTPQEFNVRHLDAAVNYPLNTIHSSFAHIDKDQLIVLYCRSGNRSGQAEAHLRGAGFTNLHNAGGLNEMLAAKP